MFINTVLEETPKTEKFFGIVRNFIESDFPVLANVKIVFSFVSPSRFLGHVPVAVKSYKFPSGSRDLFHCDFHVEFSEDAWKSASQALKLVFIWRGLRSLGVEMDESNKIKIDAAGRIVTFLAKPDVDASFYSDEVLKFGPDASLKSLSKVLSLLASKTPPPQKAKL